jgi:hypothetical protein
MQDLRTICADWDIKDDVSSIDPEEKPLAPSFVSSSASSPSSLRSDCVIITKP